VFKMTVRRSNELTSSNNSATSTGTDTRTRLEPEHVNGQYNMGYLPQIQMSEEQTGIREVWAHNVREEFRNIRTVARQGYSFVAMDTEFPGVVARPLGVFRTTQEFQYQVLRVNCDALRLIQVGLTMFNEHGQLPKGGVTTWQFNFKFNLSEDMYATDSIELLQNCGIQFQKHETDGIDPIQFSELLITSGLVLNDNVRWISFHSGYDFGYLYRILTDRRLPENEAEFFDTLKMHFPFVYDIKYLMKSCRTLKGGLQEVADELQIERLGLQHQAGSDSLVTGLTFFKMKEMFFEDNIDDTKYNGHLYGLSGNYTNCEAPDSNQQANENSNRPPPIGQGSF